MCIARRIVHFVVFENIIQESGKEIVQYAYTKVTINRAERPNNGRNFGNVMKFANLEQNDPGRRTKKFQDSHDLGLK